MTDKNVSWPAQNERNGHVFAPKPTKRNNVWANVLGEQVKILLIF